MTRRLTLKSRPYFDAMVDSSAPIEDLTSMRLLAMLGDSVTTDHISPAGSIPVDSPAGRYLIEQGVTPADFNSYGARRGNHEVMVRGTLANIRLRNQLAPGTEGGWTTHIPSGEKMFIYDASVKYAADRVPLMIIAGKEYGSGVVARLGCEGRSSAGRASCDCGEALSGSTDQIWSAWECFHYSLSRDRLASHWVLPGMRRIRSKTSVMPLRVESMRRCVRKPTTDPRRRLR